MERGRFSYADPALIEHDLRAAGFTDIELETVGLSSRVSARDAAQGMVLCNPALAIIATGRLRDARDRGCVPLQRPEERVRVGHPAEQGLDHEQARLVVAARQVAPDRLTGAVA